MSGVPIGKGDLVAGEPFDGVVVWAHSLDDVFALATEELSDKVLFTEQASATFFGPLLPHIRGIVCTKGGPSAHLAILARGLGLPCVMQAAPTEEVIAGHRVTIDGEGVVRTW